MSAQRPLDDLAALLDLAAKSGYARFDSLYTIAELVRLFQPRRVLELGTYHGCSAIFIARALPAGGRLVCVDDFTMSHVEDVRATLEQFGVADLVELHRADTRAPLEQLAGPIDLVLFDASHTDEGLLAEYRAVQDKLASPAVLVIDDAFCVPTALAEIGRGHQGMRAYSVHFGVCVVVQP